MTNENQNNSTELLQKESSGNDSSLGVGIGMAIGMSFLAALATTAFYHFTFNTAKSPLAVVDIQSISSEIEAEARNIMVNKPDATEAERSAAAQSYESKMKALQTVVSQVGDDCKCVLIIKAALLNNKNNDSNHIVDYTGTVRQKIGLQAKAEPK